MSYFNRKHIINYTKRKKSMKLQIKSFIAITYHFIGSNRNRDVLVIKRNSADVSFC